MAGPHPYLGLELLAELHVETGEPVAAGRVPGGTVPTITNKGTVTARDGVPLGLTSIAVEAPEDSPWAHLEDTPVAGSLALAGSADRPAVHLRFYTVGPV